MGPKAWDLKSTLTSPSFKWPRENEICTCGSKYEFLISEKGKWASVIDFFLIYTTVKKTLSWITQFLIKMKYKSSIKITLHSI